MSVNHLSGAVSHPDCAFCKEDQPSWADLAAEQATSLRLEAEVKALREKVDAVEACWGWGRSLLDRHWKDLIENYGQAA